jgi:YidC/Oxa1 family membrane protein insertase
MWDLLILNPMINLLLWIYSILGNFGIAIIVFTILVRVITHPLTAQQLKATQKMQEMQSSKAFQEMQKKYKDDKQKLQQEQMKLYKEMGINPLGSCLPTLIQFPIIIGLYQAIIAVLGGAPSQLITLARHLNVFSYSTSQFFSHLLPVNHRFLWMDLGQPERVMIFGFGVPILALVVVVTTYLQSKLMTPMSQPGDQGAQMTKMMNLYMPLLMGYIAWTLASGLAVYFVIGNVATIIQYALMGKINWRNMLPTSKPVAIEKTTSKRR